jgi:hypothetical protein
MAASTGARRAARGLGAALAFGLALVAAAGRAEEAPIPADLQVELLLKIYSFDRNLAAGDRGELVVGVLVQRRYRASFDAAQEILDALRDAAGPGATGRRLRAQPIVAEAPEELPAALDRTPVDILYVTPLRAFGVEQISTAARARRVRTVTAVADLVERGLAVGLRLRDDRPEIVINLSAAVAEGADFSSQLLSHARVLR